MDRNVRIAMELVRIARELVADDAVVVDDARIVVGGDGMRTAGYRMTLYDNEERKRRDMEQRHDEKLRRYPMSVSELFNKAIGMLKSELRGMKAHNGKIYVGGQGVSEGYINSCERYGKAMVLVEYSAGKHGDDIGIFFETMVKSTATNKVATIEKRFVPVDFVSRDGSKVTVDDGCFVSDNDELLNDMPRMVMDYLDENFGRLADAIDEKLYKMNTVWWKRLFNIDRF